MATLERWATSLFAALAVAVFCGGGDGNPQESEYEKSRQLIESMAPAEKRELYDKQQRFLRLNEEKREQLRALHLDLQKQENREELERVMDAYFEWVCSLSPSERSKLDQLSAEDRVELVMKYKNSRRRDHGRRGGFRGPWPVWERMGRGGRTPDFDNREEDFRRDYVKALKEWAGWYVTEHAEPLASLLPPEKAEQWKGGLKDLGPEASQADENRWIHLVRWYLAGAKQDLPLGEEDVAQLEKTMSPEIRKWFERLPQEIRIREIRGKLGGMIWYHFVTGQPEFAELIAADELKRFSEDLPPDRQEFLKRMPPDKRPDWLRLLYFTSKLPPDMLDFRDNRSPFTPGGRSSSHGPPNRDGTGPRRGPGGDFRDRDDGPRGMRSDRPDMAPPSGPGPGEER